MVTPEGSPTTETPSTSSPLTQNSSFTSHRAESKVTAQTLTGTLFKVPECFQVNLIWTMLLRIAAGAMGCWSCSRAPLPMAVFQE